MRVLSIALFAVAAHAAQASVVRGRALQDDVVIASNEGDAIEEARKGGVKIKDDTGYLTFTTSCLNVNFHIFYCGGDPNDEVIDFIGGGAPNANCFPYEKQVGRCSGTEAWRCHPQKDVNYDFKIKDYTGNGHVFLTSATDYSNYAADANDCNALLYYRLSCEDRTFSNEIDLSSGVNRYKIVNCGDWDRSPNSNPNMCVKRREQIKPRN